MTMNAATNRRRFLKRTFAVSASLLLAESGGAAIQTRYVLHTEQDSIEVVRGVGQQWTTIQVVRSQAPASLTIHPSQRVLYVANAISLHQGLPRGTVEVFAIDHRTGELSLEHEQALSLSATEPRSLAITSDARHLVAAAYAGGVYNVLSIDQNGALGGVCHIFKELGSGPHPTLQRSAHPHTLRFDRSGRFLLASDFGCDHVSVFSLDPDGRLERKSKHLLPPGAGPGAIDFSASGSLLYIRHELSGATSGHRYDSRLGCIEEASPANIAFS